MSPALARLARFPNVRVLPVCSTPQSLTNAVWQGRPTDYLPQLLPADVIYACGAPAMVDAIKEIAAQCGVVCHADPFLPTTSDTADDSVLSRAMARSMSWLAVPASRQVRQLALDRPRNLRERPAGIQNG
jgi:hypothetical protein